MASGLYSRYRSIAVPTSGQFLLSWGRGTHVASGLVLPGMVSAVFASVLWVIFLFPIRNDSVGN